MHRTRTEPWRPLLELDDYGGHTPKTIKQMVDKLIHGLRGAAGGEPGGRAAAREHALLEATLIEEAARVNEDGLLEAAAGMDERAKALFPQEYLRLFHQAALYEARGVLYEHLAIKLGRSSPACAQAYHRAGEAYHFAGHAYRGLEDYRKAGLCYEKSADCHSAIVREKRRTPTPDDKRRAEPLPAAIRSFSRAKGVWDDAGDYETAGRVYFEEQRLRVEQAYADAPLKGLALKLWGAVTGYGERIDRWGASLLVMVLLFAALRRALGGESGFWGPLQSSIQSTLLMPGAGPHGGAAWLDILQTACSYFMLGIGVSVIVRKFSPR